MASRNSPRRQIPGNPLAGILRAAARGSRTVSRRKVPEGPVQALSVVPGPEGPAEHSRPSWTPYRPSIAVVVTGDDGSVAWTWDWDPGEGTPVVVATAQTDRPVVVTVTDVTSSSVTVRAWRQDKDRALRAAPGVPVHVAAFEGPWVMGDGVPVSS